MSSIVYQKLTEQNFHPDSLATFERYQEVTDCWRKTGWVLNPFIESWNPEECAAVAAEVLQQLANGAGYGAFDQGVCVGFATIDHALFGSERQYCELKQMHVSRPFRGQGVGRRLFAMACGGAREAGARKLYISAHSARESQAFYARVGCVPAQEINQAIAAHEPCDVQMECDLFTK